MTWRDLPIRLKLYILTLTTIALPILWYAGWNLLFNPPPRDSGWIVLIVLTVLTVPFYLLLPSVSTIVGIGDAYVMSVAMIYGTPQCIAATLCHTLAGSLFVPNRPKIYAHRVVFNIASTICCAWIYSTLYEQLNPNLSRTGPAILLPIVVLTTSFFFLNSLSTATAISLASGQNILRFWTQNYLSLGVEFSVSAVSAAVIVTLYRDESPWIPLAVAPLIGVVWGWNKLNKAKAMEAAQHLKEQENLYLRTVESLALAVDAKDQTTYGHIRRVRAYAMGLGELCGIRDPNELMAIETGSLLHDIGKLAIDDYILNKPGRLTKQEFDKMKLHSSAGDEILRQIRFPFPVAEYVRYHHERWDGLGYPDGLKGDQIPLGARILAIADAFDAIRSSRPYKTSFGTSDSIELLRAQSGTAYDPHLVDLFVCHIDELQDAANEAATNMPELSFRKYFEKVNLALSSPSASESPCNSQLNVSSELLFLFEFCQSLGRQLELPDILSVLARRLKLLVPYTTCSFYFDNGDGVIVPEYVAGKHSEFFNDFYISVGKGISGWVAAYKRPIINAQPMLEFQDLAVEPPLYADILAVPLLNDDTCLGTISLYSNVPSTYTDTFLTLLQSIACQATPLIEEARSRRLSTPIDSLDPVTLTHGTSYLHLAAVQLMASADRTHSPLSLLCLDIRNYAQLLNLYGTDISNTAMRKVAEVLKRELRETDVLVRYGNHAFIALLPGVRAEQAHRYAQRLHLQVRGTPIVNALGHSLFVISQIAVAAYPNDGRTLVDLLHFVSTSIAEHTRLSNPFDDNSVSQIIEFPPRQT
jgi:diguanylate cyclase (GGDEF)-like protein